MTNVAGDALLTLWKVDSFVKMKVTVGHVIKCALDIQQKCGMFQTTVGVVLRVKIGKSPFLEIIIVHS